MKISVHYSTVEGVEVDRQGKYDKIIIPLSASERSMGLPVCRLIWIR